MPDYGIFDLTGKVAIVTGASRGLGRAMAEALAEYGADVACVGRDKAKLQETVSILEKYGHGVTAIQADVTKVEDVKNMVTETVSKFGKINVLINNAGIARGPCPIHETPEEDWNIVIESNQTSVFLCMKYVIPELMKAGNSSIINISSIAGLRAEDPECGMLSYGASKAAVMNMTQVAALQYAKKGIRVNCIAPGMHESELGQNNPGPKPSPEKMEAMMKQMGNYFDDEIPMGRMAKARELAGLTVLLASDSSSYITGQIISQDGGQSCRI